MIQVIHDNEGVHSVKIHNTTYSPEALALLASEVERLRAGLQAIAIDDVAPWTFADALLKGASVDAAKAEAQAIEPPSEDIEASVRRVLARRELVKAALGHYRRARILGIKPGSITEEHLFAMCDAFLAAGGNEVTG